MSAEAPRYTAVAIVLHWAIAFAIALMIPLGWWMHENAEAGRITEGVFRAFQLHKSIGLTILALSLIRLGWRLLHPPPPMPAHMPGWERLAARASHWMFYALMVGLPLTGWLYVSAGWSIHDDEPVAVATRYFGLFNVPPLFGLSAAGAGLREEVAEAAFTAHALMAWSAVGLLALHVVAALKHHVFDRDEVLAHMVPGLRAPFETRPRPREPLRLAALGFGFAAIAIAMSAALYAVANLNRVETAQAPPPSRVEIVEPGASPAPEAVAAPGAAAPEAPPAQPATWRVDPRASSIRFAFDYDDQAGAPTRFEGRFRRWRADIRFDPANLAQSYAAVTIETASASDGVELHDDALPTEPWFDSANYPHASFRTTEIRRDGDGYRARGRLTIKGRAREVDLPFTLIVSGDVATMAARTSIDRRDFDIGERSDADDFISRDIELDIRVEAVRER